MPVARIPIGRHGHTLISVGSPTRSKAAVTLYKFRSQPYRMRLKASINFELLLGCSKAAHVFRLMAINTIVFETEFDTGFLRLLTLHPFSLSCHLWRQDSKDLVVDAFTLTLAIFY